MFRPEQDDVADVVVPTDATMGQIEAAARAYWASYMDSADSMRRFTVNRVVEMKRVGLVEVASTAADSPGFRNAVAILNRDDANR